MCHRVDHINCTGITGISSVDENIKSSAFLDGINRNIIELGANIKNVLSLISKQELKINSQSRKIETSVHSIFDNNLLNNRYEMRFILSDLSLKKYKCKKNMKDFRKKVEEVEVAVCEMVNHLRKLEEYCSDSQIFREIVKLDKDINNAAETFKTLSRNAKTLTLHCESIKDFDFQTNPVAKRQIFVHSEPFFVGSKLSTYTSRKSAQVIFFLKILKKYRF